MTLVRLRLAARCARAVTALAIALGAAAPAFAWGPDGHRIVGEIAWQLLDRDTKQAVLAILPRGRDGTLAEAAVWADTVGRRDPAYRWLEPFHYVDVAPDARAIPPARGCHCVLEGIEMARDRLRDPRVSPAQRLLALRELAHFVGDVHQPLHVSHPDGRGGNTIDVSFDGRPTNLHRLWDGDLLQRRLRALGRRRGGRWRAFAHALADATSAAQRKEWAAATDPRVWAEESLALARAHTFAVRDGDRLGDAYYEEAIPVVTERLAQAGVRLAAVLATSLGPIR